MQTKKKMKQILAKERETDVKLKLRLRLRLKRKEVNWMLYTAVAVVDCC